MINILAGNEWLVLHLALVVLPVVHVMISASWEQPAKAGWVLAILFFNLFAYGVFLFITANRINRSAMEAARVPTRAEEVSANSVPIARMSTLFVVGRWISTFGRRAAISIAVGIIVWVLIHLGNSDWMRESYWPFYFPLLFVYWLPVEISGQILMAAGRKRPPPAKPGA